MNFCLGLPGTSCQLAWSSKTRNLTAASYEPACQACALKSQKQNGVHCLLLRSGKSWKRSKKQAERDRKGTRNTFTDLTSFSVFVVVCCCRRFLLLLLLLWKSTCNEGARAHCGSISQKGRNSRETRKRTKYCYWGCVKGAASKQADKHTNKQTDWEWREMQLKRWGRGRERAARCF